ncbi:MAG TPA: aspartyl protease family protein [Candidatus Limnocylindrales bacterium]|nr:aspartyl protease family protein [Candidatus Limnocylindrales bacterium]
MALFNQGHFREAAAAYQRMAEGKTSSPEAYAGAVQSLLKLDDVDAAKQESAKGLQAFPQSAVVLAAGGDVEFRRGRIQEAAEQYRAALKLDEKCARAWLGLGRIYAADSDRNQARQAFARAHELAPDDGDALYYWALGLPYPQNVASLQKHFSEFRDNAEKEMHEHEYIQFLQALGGRRVWIPARRIERTEIKLHPVISRVQDGPRAFSLQVRLNEHVSANVMLDTGASGLTISRKMAEKAGVTKLSDHSLEGVGNGGPARGYEAWADKVVIGELEFHDCQVHVSPRDSPDYDGLIGTDVFEDYLVTVDFPAHKLRLEPMPAAGSQSGSFTRFYRFGHILLLPTSVGSSAHGLFAMDTGSAANSISPALARQVSALHDSDVPVNGISGSVKNVFTADHVMLQFSRFRQPHENIITFDVHGLSKDLGTEVSGFIGFATLKKMKVQIDYRDGLVDFDYKP